MFRSIVFTIAAMCAVILTCGTRVADAQTWNLDGDGTWNDASNWNPAVIPNAIGAAVVFNAAVEATRTITTDSGDPGFTVGSISYNSTAGTTQTTRINIGATMSNLIFDNGGAGVSFTTSGTGTGNFTLFARTRFDDDVIATINQTTESSAAGSLNITATITGTGGFTKEGDGVATFGTNAKSYTGATVINGGRFRISVAGQPSMSPSVTVNSGGQIVFAGAANDFILGAGSLFLNGTGSSVFPGAVRADGGARVITNAVVLQSDASIAVPGSANTLTLPNIVSGPGRLEVGALPGDPINQGMLILNNTNTYAGGTRITQGTLVVSGSSATLGSGNVFVDGLSTGPNASVAAGILEIQAGVADAIANGATLTLTGDDGSDAFIGGIANLGAGVNEVIGGLVLNGVTQGAGTYGSTASTAMFQNDAFFSSFGSGIVEVVLAGGVTGDYNGNGIVDAADYTVWRDNLGAAAGTLPNDVDGGIIDTDQYNTWVTNFGNTAGSGNALATAVPEPGSMFLAWLALGSFVWIRHVRRKLVGAC